MSELLQPIFDVYGAEPPLAIHIHAYDDGMDVYSQRRFCAVNVKDGL